METDEDIAATRIVRALALRPGAGAALLARLVGRSRNAVDHALHGLLRARRIVDVGDGREHSYFLPDSGAGLTHALHAPELRFVDHVMLLDGATGSQLAQALQLSRSEVSRLGTSLGQRGLVVVVKRGRDMLYLPRAS